MEQFSLFAPVNLGKIQLKNRIVMAPMTRSRADTQDIPTDIMIEYYRQRASAGLIITEGVHTSIHAKGYPRTPGIYTLEQIHKWQQITQAVHAEGGKIFLQIMHVGRIAHPLNKDLAAETVAPSPIQAAGTIYTDQQGLQAMALPRALGINEIPGIIEEYRQATYNAFAAGFDGVELHAASGYLPMQFLASNTNLRTDQYGGSVANRVRFVIELLQAMASVQGADKIGIRIWPGSTFNDIHDENPIETHSLLLQEINQIKLAYVHVVRSPIATLDAFKLVREHFRGMCIINGDLNLSAAQAIIDSGLGDLVSFGALYVANPDLIERLRQNAPLNALDESTLYTAGAKGYIDYPRL